MNVQPLGDQAAMAYCPDEEAALALAGRLRRQSMDWLVDVVQAYTSVAVFFDLQRIDFARVSDTVRQLGQATDAASSAGKLHVIPCCYSLGLDLGRVAATTGLDEQRIVEMHAGRTYTVYAIGFCPGFPYLGYLPEELCGVARLDSPRLRVEAGSVGLTGRQTGIYTEERPGGWNIVGRTPLQLVDVKDAFFPLRTGDQVRFRAIDEKEYRELEGRRLE